jgi:hypothetical protein
MFQKDRIDYRHCKGDSMQPYAPYRPRMSQPIIAAPTPAVVAPSVVAPTVSTPMTESLLWTALAAGASWAAIQTALRKDTKTVAKIAGWAGGVAAGLVALTGLTGVLAPTAARELPVRWYWAG